MRNAALWILLAAAIPGCGGGGPWFREAMVLYRSPLQGPEKPIFFGFVTDGHRAYMTAEGNVLDELPGAKPLDAETAAECLDVFRDNGWPDGFDKAGSLASALALDPKGHVIICEIDGDLRVMARPGPGSGGDSQERLTAFVACKSALIEYGGYRTGFRVISNSEGDSLFDRERERLAKEGLK